MYFKSEVIMSIQDPEFTYFIANNGTNPRLFNSNDHSFEQAMEYFKSTISTEKLSVHQYNESRTRFKTVHRYGPEYKDVKAHFHINVWRGKHKELEDSINELIQDIEFRAVSQVKEYLSLHWGKLSKKAKFVNVGMEITPIE